MPARHRACSLEEMPPGSRRLVRIGTRSIGLFNVNGSLHALLNKCPHAGGNLCEGRVGGTNRPAGLENGYHYDHGREGEVLRCALHGWEFDIATGTCLTDPKVKARIYPVEVEAGSVYIVA